MNKVRNHGSRRTSAWRAGAMVAVASQLALGCAPVDEAGEPTVDGLEQASQCGATLDFQNVEQYDGTLGVTRAFVDAHQAPVAQIQWKSDLASRYTDPGNVNGARWCSGTMIAPDLFLTAGHCFDKDIEGWRFPRTSAGAAIESYQAAREMQLNFNYQRDAKGVLRTAQSFAITELVEHRLGGLDYAIVRVSGAPGMSYGYTGVSTSDANKGDSIAIIGHPDGLPKQIEAGTADSFSGDTISYGSLDTLGGNSGSGILQASTGKVIGVHTNGGCTSTGGANSGYRITSLLRESPTLRSLVAHTEYTIGDFNGDGLDDQIITTASGSYWYFSKGDGTWNVPYTRTDLPLGTVRYVPGDFNGDRKTDLVITTASGSYWYFSNGNGTWSNPYTRTDLPFGRVEYVPGDFNGDDKTDLVITTASGSYWYFSNGDGSWNNAYTRTDLPLGEVEYTTGDFNVDYKRVGDLTVRKTVTDLVITTRTGSYWYISKGNGQWDVPYSRSDLPLGQVQYTPGDFNGDSTTDLIVATASGSYWYFTKSDTTFDAPYTRSDLPLHSVQYTTGDFDANGKTDLVIATRTGSYWYFSNGDGSWTNPYTRTDLPMSKVRYVPANFNSDVLSSGGLNLPVRRTDLVVSTQSGSYWYFSRGNGQWDVPYTRTDLPL